MTTSPKVVEKQEPVSVDVSTEETHYSVQCDDIRLISSVLKPSISKSRADKSHRISFQIHAVVDGNKAYSYLEVAVNQHVSGHPSKLTGFELSYVLMGVFSAQEDMPPAELGNFVKMYTLTILWPYAREFATDLFRRTGTEDIVLPIINPQVVTEHIVENNLVEVKILRKRPKRS